MSPAKPIASLSLDLDNKWSYLKTHGEAGWETFPSYLDVVVPRVLTFLRERQLKITFFIVGQDAALTKNHEALRSITEAGHEVGNHSFNHEPWLHLYSEEEIDAEIARAEESIHDATGKLPLGFRGPGFSLSPTVLQVLARRGYQYDCSTFPTYLGPLARMYYFMTARLTAEQKRERSQLFGRWQHGLRPLHPYHWRTLEGNLLEIPVTTMPFCKTPIHFSYLIYLSLYSPWLARWYFRAALSLCRITNTPPSLLLHPLDFLGNDDDQELAFFPAMGMRSSRKLELVGHFVDRLLTEFHVVPMEEHANVAKTEALRVVACQAEVRNQARISTVSGG